MTIKYFRDLPCPDCGKMNTIVLWDSINVQLDPEGRQELLDGKLHEYECSGCGKTSVVEKTFLYHDMNLRFMVWHYPFQDTEDPNFLDQFKEDGRLDTQHWFPSPEDPDYSVDVHYVFSMSEVVRYILFRERLAKRKESIRKGKVTCFCCGNTVENDQDYFCIQRRLLKRGESPNRKQDEVLNSTSSIQACAECLKKAAAQKIEIKSRPLPLLQIEQKGFFKFARQLAAGKPVRSLKSENCTLCQTPIAAREHYVQIEITEESSDEGGVKVKKAHSLGMLCHKCAEQYTWGSMEGI